MEDATITPTSKLKSFVRRPVVALALGACAVASVFVFLTVNDGPKVSASKVPIPFIPGENHQGPGGGSNLAGSVTYIRTLASGVEFYEMDFVGDPSQQAPADKVYLIKVPSGVDPIPFERMVLDSNGSTRPYYGYLYTTPNATQEIANQTATGFNVRFPGIFFASAAAMAAHGADLTAFATQNGIVFKNAGAYAVNHNNVLLDGPQLIAFVPVDQALTIDITNICGNTWKGSDEECDDGDVDNGDGCSSSCLVESGFTCDEDSPSICVADAVCGDGFRTQGEACDDGNTAASDGCSATCAIEAGYVCDTSSPNICLQTCGNGDVQNGEVCDDGNITAGDGCSATCQEENGFTCTGDPSVCDPDAAAPVCGNSLREGDLCGNAFVDNDEECDYAIECEFTADGDDCTCHDDCTICDGQEDCTFNAPAYSGETCDDGDTTAGDGCDATCDVEDGFTCDTATPNVCSVITICGNGTLEGAEVCDDNDADSGDGCSSTCQVEAGFTCDGDEPTVCTPDPECGDGTKTQGEDCDDGNVAAGDGCNATCDVEAGFACDNGTPNICLQTCGDGDLDNGEDCDDGNAAAGDGCNTVCDVESGWTCDQSEPSVCDPDPVAPVCGNDIREGDLCGNQFVDNDEECDYAVDCAGVADGQPCDCHEDCTLCDGQEDCTFNAPAYSGETCDDGDTDAGDGCNATCDVENGYSCDTATPNVCSLIDGMCLYADAAVPSISDDGRYVVYSGISQDGEDQNIVLFDSQTDVTVGLTGPAGAPESADSEAVISGDGDFVAFSGVTGVSDEALVIYDRNGDTFETLSMSGRSLSLSDDGDKLLFTSQSCLIVFETTGNTYRNVAGPDADCLTGITPLVNSGNPMVTTTEFPYQSTISGNGRYVFFLVDDEAVPTDKDLYRVDLQAGTTELVVTEQIGSYLSVTADGDNLIYGENSAGEFNEVLHNFTLDSDTPFDLEGVLAGGDTNVLRISSDGTKYLVFGGSNNGNLRYGVYDAVQSQLITEILDQQVGAWSAISGDGNWVTFTENNSGPQSDTGLYLYDVAQEATEEITAGLYQCD